MAVKALDDYTTGGVQAKYICIGGCTFTENGDAYCCGIFAFAKISILAMRINILMRTQPLR